MQVYIIPKSKLRDLKNRKTLDLLKLILFTEERGDGIAIFFENGVDIEKLKEDYPEVENLLGKNEEGGWI